jgi:acyl carrier protein
MDDKTTNPNDSDRVAAAFRNALRLDSGFVLADEMGFNDIPGWDSLGHVSLITELEDRFGISLGMDDIVMIDSLKAAREVVARKSGGA